MSQLLRQASGSTGKVAKPKAKEGYNSPIARLHDKGDLIPGTTPRHRGKSAKASFDHLEYGLPTKIPDRKEFPKNVSLSDMVNDLSTIQPQKHDQPSFLDKLNPKLDLSSTPEQSPQAISKKDDQSISVTSKQSLSSTTAFDWDSYLGDKSYSTKLINNIIPHLFRARVNKVLGLMDNVTCYPDL